MTDQELYEKCKKYGYLSLEARRRFAGLLPEVERRKLWRKKGYSSIYEFAARLAGMSVAQVDEVLRLERRLTDKPDLHRALIEGEVGAAKLKRVASIATVENQAELAASVRVLSTSAVNTLIRDQKSVYVHTLENEPELCQPRLAGDVAAELYELQCKGVDINEQLREFLRFRRTRIAEQKPRKSVTRKIRQLVREEQGTKCVQCDRPAVQLHHLKKRSEGGANHPKNLQPLCAEHHAIIHASERLQFWSG